MTKDEKRELSELQDEMHLCSLGDRPQSIAADKLRRLIDLESKVKEGERNPGRPKRGKLTGAT